jgi:hypothetical protein
MERAAISPARITAEWKFGSEFESWLTRWFSALAERFARALFFWLEWGLREVGRWGTLVALFL